MSTIQVTACGPHGKSLNVSSSIYSPLSRLCSSPIYSSRFRGTCPSVALNAPIYRRCTPVCSFGGKGKPENGNEDSPWKALEKAMGGIRKEQSVQDILREQMQKQEFAGGGGIGSPPSGSGGGGSEDDGFSEMWDELLQASLATIGFIFMYIYILNGAELSRLAKDYIKFLFSKQKSVRLRRAMYKWRRFFRIIVRKKKVGKPYALERAIANTPTWWNASGQHWPQNRILPIE
ncbi:hypothetical protein GIB67_011055 [Kingdonia uniflora]|uniref:Glycine-rich protein n=1 Tax=Kingdonia uniflora TaxID=39325 RepID=A0A7J7L6E6_9MAGN|nr:hypothetical protein GIB67_011055 [Kingdonia uniflora]